MLRQRIYLPVDFRYAALSSSAASHTSQATSLILVPHDGTEMSENALKKAVEFAHALKAKIILLHIVDDRIIPPSDTIGFVSDEQPSLEVAKTQLIRILKQGAELMLKDRDVQGETNGNRDSVHDGSWITCGRNCYHFRI